MRNEIYIRPYDTPDGFQKLCKAFKEAEAVVIGAGAGLSTAAGFIYGGERFQRFFGDFAARYGFRDMYAGGFYPYGTPEEKWAFWSRNIYVNRFMHAPKPLYETLYALVKDKDYFVLTTNVDHQFQKAGFDKARLFYTQGDYGLWQCSGPCHKRTYNNKSGVVKMVLSQGFLVSGQGELIPPETEDGRTDFDRLSMTVPSDLIPYCPVCGEPMTMNLRSDDTFVEDEGWHQAADRYADFLKKHRDKKVLFLELGTGFNTPSIIKFAFWQMTEDWPQASYACLNRGEAFAPEEIQGKSICINEDLETILNAMAKECGPDGGI